MEEVLKGQQEVLKSWELTKSMGCEIRSSMRTVDYGLVTEGIHCHFDANAARAAGLSSIESKLHETFPEKLKVG